MGGRGSKSGINSGALNKNAKEQVIETYCRKIADMEAIMVKKS